MTKKIVGLRRDITNYHQYPKEELIRFVIKKDGSVFLDEKQTIPGYGVYVHKLNLTRALQSKNLLRKINKSKGNITKEELQEMIEKIM